MDRKKLITFDFGQKPFHILAPTQQQLMRIDLEYRCAYSLAIRKGIMTELEAKQKFQEMGVWSEKQEKQLRDFQVQLANLELQLEGCTDEKDGKSLAFEILKTRNAMLDLSGHKTSIFSSQTAEGYATEAKRASLAALCSVDNEMNPVFGTIEAFSQNSNDSLVATCYAQAILADVGLSLEDISKPTMEREWLQSHGYINSANGELSEKYFKETVADLLPQEKAKENSEKPEKKKRKSKNKE